jgi:hypothetical protein
MSFSLPGLVRTLRIAERRGGCHGRPVVLCSWHERSENSAGPPKPTTPEQEGIELHPD